MGIMGGLLCCSNTNRERTQEPRFTWVPAAGEHTHFDTQYMHARDAHLAERYTPRSSYIVILSALSEKRLAFLPTP